MHRSYNTTSTPHNCAGDSLVSLGPAVHAASQCLLPKDFECVRRVHETKIENARIQQPAMPRPWQRCRRDLKLIFNWIGDFVAFGLS